MLPAAKASLGRSLRQLETWIWLCTANPARTGDVGFVVSAYRPAVFVCVPLVLGSWLIENSPLLQAVIFWTGALSLYIPQTHKLAHVNHNVLIASIQKAHVILSPREHLAHHHDNTRAYCVFTGWLNPLLDHLRFWRALERLFPPLDA
jgi:hypothetical protein